MTIFDRVLTNLTRISSESSTTNVVSVLPTVPGTVSGYMLIQFDICNKTNVNMRCSIWTLSGGAYFDMATQVVVPGNTTLEFISGKKIFVKTGDSIVVELVTSDASTSTNIGCVTISYMEMETE